MADDLMKKELIAHKVYSAWQFITYTEKNISTVQYCADTIDNIIGKMTMKTVRWQQDISTDFVDDITEDGKKSKTIIGYNGKLSSVRTKSCGGES